MDDRENARHWEENAGEWVRLVRMGFDESRVYCNSPAFFGVLPEVGGLRGLDLGCGEGQNSRDVVGLGAKVVALDVSDTMVRAVAEDERREARGLRVVRASGLELPFGEQAFDFVVAFMSLMDMPQHARVLAEVHRVLRPGGFFQFSITHPCFQTPKWQWLYDDRGRKSALACGDYFRELDGDIEEWTFGAALRAGETPRRFRIPRFTHTLSSWLNLILDAGFVLERFVEPTVDDATVAAHPGTSDHRIIAYFLIVRARKAV